MRSAGHGRCYGTEEEMAKRRAGKAKWGRDGAGHRGRQESNQGGVLGMTGPGRNAEDKTDGTVERRASRD